jgi:uncharacterized membrane protein YphA (DoxX/SURF4 family)
MKTRNASILLWTAQLLLAALFLFAGGMKLVLPAAALAGPVPLPVGFLRFIGVMETLGALGLLLPGLFRIRRELTPVAAAGLVIVMSGATVVTLLGGQIAPALVPFVIATIASSIAYGRREWVRPLPPRVASAAPRGSRRPDATARQAA